MLPALDYETPPQFGVVPPQSHPLYPALRRMQQALLLGASRYEEPRGQNQNPYTVTNPELTQVQDLIPLPGEDLDENTGQPLGHDMMAVFYHTPMFLSVTRSLGIQFSSIVADLARCRRPGFMSSPGKSPTFFIFGETNEYIVKQLKPKELDLMLRICSSYGQYLSQHPSSLVVRFLSMFTVTKPLAPEVPYRTRKGDKHYVVMRNVLLTTHPLAERYDLKGSWVGRYTPTSSRDPTRTLKDRNIEEFVYLTTLRRRLLIHQLQKDVEWFASCNLIDYSLILGISEDIPCIHQAELDESIRFKVDDIPQEEPHSVPDLKQKKTQRTDMQDFYEALQATGRLDAIIESRDISKLMPPFGASKAHDLDSSPRFEDLCHLPSLFSSEEGGLYAFSPVCNMGPTTDTSVLRYRVIYAGVIDFLTPYGASKRFERRAKGICHEKQGLSVMPSREYATRFMRFMRMIFQVPISEEHGVVCNDCSEFTVYEEN
ncbi:putative Phosphatidylinositol-4-phosphate 5-kinase [Giardia muris]|uniref:Putative Phosphatidylinositol-4-phosphate 5-kinase n=1 Tax=Giardia muris TaxID=5742 RepID=A0A4Z1T5W3_GIAMU|nr:putative Phosphatidylinositol-4-phosphate 5-kinase [Giardia muris]|eukprot:TNJ28527.1 putative Phosphatidylinositol-4-phosphate 5-kinase [Giardia muris]